MDSDSSRSARILYDILYLQSLPLYPNLRMTGILRVIAKWGEHLSRRKDVAWVGRISEERTALIAATGPEFDWLDAKKFQIPTMTSSTPLTRSLYEASMVPFARKDKLSKARRYAGFRWWEKENPREAGRILEKRAATGGKFVYHLPITSDLPEAIPRGCVPLINVYDLVPMIFTDTYDAYSRKRFEQAIVGADRVNAHFLVNAAATRHDLVSRFAVPPERVHVVMLGADQAAGNVQIEKNPQSTTDPFFLYVSSDAQRRKNIPIAIRAFAKFARATGGKYLLKIVGGGTDRLVADLKAKGEDTQGVEGLGVVDAATLENLYRDAYCGLYMSIYEGFGLPVIECMRRRVPVISSNATSLPEVGGDSVLWVDPLDEGAIIAAMSRIVNDPALRESLIASGYERSLQLTWKASADRLQQIYEELLA